jgi:hypothetical protein
MRRAGVSHTSIVGELWERCGWICPVPARRLRPSTKPHRDSETKRGKNMWLSAEGAKVVVAVLVLLAVAGQALAS